MKRPYGTGQIYEKWGAYYGPEGLSLPPFPLGLGGAGRFLDALVSEVMPEVEARHPADPADRTLVGHSLGGLLALFMLFDRPAAFGRYVVVSPSIWSDDRVILSHEQAWADDHADLRAHVFVAVGREEQATGGGWRNESFPDEAIAAVRQVDNCRELSHGWRLRGHRSPTVESVGLDGEYHLTVGAAAITCGLISLFSAGNVALRAERIARAARSPSSSVARSTRHSSRRTTRAPICPEGSSWLRPCTS